MSEKKEVINSLFDLVKILFNADNWYLGGFIIALVLFIIFDIVIYK